MFSVVIPLYNKEQSITNTIQSVLDQTFQDFEIVVVNDGSTDKSVERVKEFDDPRIRVIDKPNGGVSSARNRGIEEAKYEWIAFLDGDDWWKEKYLYEMNNLINDFPHAVIYGANYSVLDNVAISIKKNNLSPNFRGILVDYYKIALNSMLFSSSSTIIDKKKVGDILFDERLSLGEDLDFWLRCTEKGAAAYYNTALAVYNHDDPMRAMNKKHDITKNYIFHSEKYEGLEAKDKDFNRLINSLRLRKIPEVFLNSNATDEQLKHFLSLIDYTYQNSKHTYFAKLPFLLKKLVIYLKYKSKF